MFQIRRALPFHRGRWIACAHVRARARKCARKYANAHADMQTRTQARTHAHKHARMNACTFARTRAHARMHAQMAAPIHFARWSLSQVSGTAALARALHILNLELHRELRGAVKRLGVFGVGVGGQIPWA